MAGVQMGFADGIAKTPFIARVDRDLCDYCGDCLKTCNVKCIGLDRDARQRPRGERFAAVDPAVCLGCAACTTVCERNALSLTPRMDHVTPPKSKGRLFAHILWEKGRLAPFAAEGVKKGLRSAIGKIRRTSRA